jgi:hypothetical protein
MVHSIVNHDCPEPGFEGPFDVELADGVKNFHKPVVKNFSGLVPIVSIAKADAHAIAIELMVELFLALPFLLPASLQDLDQSVCGFFQTMLLLKHPYKLNQKEVAWKEKFIFRITILKR